jgi:hypothetical protein
MLPGCALLLGLVWALPPVAARADTATDTPPLIGKLQIVRWNGAGVNHSLDGTIICAAFGGPEDIPPPSPFSGSFSFVGGQFRPNTLDPGVSVVANLDSDRDGNWIYAFRIINDEGDDAIEGGALINSVNLSLPLCTSIIDEAIVTVARSGVYVTEYGSTLEQGGLIPFNFAIIPAGSSFFNLIISGPVLQPGETTETFCYYSPFAPSNQNGSFLGQDSGQSRAHTIINALPTAQFYPHVSCELRHLSSTSGGGETIYDLVCSVTSELRSLDPITVNPALPGNVLQVHDPIDGPRSVASECVVTVSANPIMGSCVRFRLGGGGDVPGPLQGSLFVDTEGNEDFPFTIVRADACGDEIEIAAAVSAMAPYDLTPPFEGHTKLGEDLPQLDADENLPCRALFLHPPDPGTASAVNAFRFSGAVPAFRVFLVAGLRNGSTTIPGCDGLSVAIADPRREAVRSVMPDMTGKGQINLNVPVIASGRTVLFQLVQYQTDPCKVSNLVRHTFP